ncbi:MAG: BON domain-containing protein [Bdellovibrionales bacterium]
MTKFLYAFALATSFSTLISYSSYGASSHSSFFPKSSSTDFGSLHSVDDDEGIVERIRGEFIKDDALSVQAQNLKIYSDDGVITLNGLVRSDAELERVVRLVEALPGVRLVNNEMTVTPDYL